MKSSMIQGQCVQLPIIHTRLIGTKISHSLSLFSFIFFWSIRLMAMPPTIIHSRSQEWWLLCHLYITHPNRWEKNSIARDDYNNTTNIPNCYTQICCALCHVPVVQKIIIIKSYVYMCNILYLYKCIYNVYFLSLYLVYNIEIMYLLVSNLLSLFEFYFPSPPPPFFFPLMGLKGTQFRHPRDPNSPQLVPTTTNVKRSQLCLCYTFLAYVMHSQIKCCVYCI